MRKNWLERFLAQGGVFLIVPILILVGQAPILTKPSDMHRGPVTQSIVLPVWFIGLGADAECTDSDGGQEPLVAGYVEGVGPNGYPFQKFDSCVDDDNVKEFFCNGTIPWPIKIGCELGCSDGACLSDCTDEDQDGYSPQGGSCGLVDCDDTNPLVNPGEDEVCGNGLDDDCNGLVDGDDPACVVCTDNDVDGYAVEGGLCGAVDCDDDDYFVNPGMAEVCDNGIDDDCDGAVDGDDAQCLGTNVIVIGWDGTQLDHFWDCYNGLLEGCYDGLPEIASLTGGDIFPSIVTSGATSTKAGWAQIFTGYRAEVTGVLSNGQYQPIPLGYTVFEKVEDAFGDENVITAFYSGKDVNTGDACVGEETLCVGAPCLESKGQPWCIASDYIDYFDSGTEMRFNEAVTAAALDLLTTHQNDLIFAAFIYREPDVIGHVAGEDSVSYSASIARVDYQTGLIIDKLIELGIYDSTKIYIVSDHGFDEGGNRHGNAPFTFVSVNDGTIIRSGDRYDLAATLLADFGITLGAVGPAPALDGYPLSWDVTYSCVPEGSAYYDGGPACCAGLTLISLDFPTRTECMLATGGTGNNSGWCTSCGNGTCDAHENSCNCAADCQ